MAIEAKSFMGGSAGAMPRFTDLSINSFTENLSKKADREKQLAAKKLEFDLLRQDKLAQTANSNDQWNRTFQEEAKRRAVLNSLSNQQIASSQAGVQAAKDKVIYEKGQDKKDRELASAAVTYSKQQDELKNANDIASLVLDSDKTSAYIANQKQSQAKNAWELEKAKSDSKIAESVMEASGSIDAPTNFSMVDRNFVVDKTRDEFAKDTNVASDAWFQRSIHDKGYGALEQEAITASDAFAGMKDPGTWQEPMINIEKTDENPLAKSIYDGWKDWGKNLIGMGGKAVPPKAPVKPKVSTEKQAFLDQKKNYDDAKKKQKSSNNALKNFMKTGNAKAIAGVSTVKKESEKVKVANAVKDYRTEVLGGMKKNFKSQGLSDKEINKRMGIYKNSDSFKELITNQIARVQGDTELAADVKKQNAAAYTKANVESASRQKIAGDKSLEQQRSGLKTILDSDLDILKSDRDAFMEDGDMDNVRKIDAQRQKMLDSYNAKMMNLKA